MGDGKIRMEDGELEGKMEIKNGGWWNQKGRWR